MTWSDLTIPDSSDGTGEELFALADAIAVVIGGSVAIEDLDTRVLAYSTVPGGRIDELRRQGILGRRVPDQPGPQGEGQVRQYREVLAATGVVRLPALADSELPRAAVAIRAGDLPLGTIWAIEDHNPLDAAGEHALLDGARTAALHMLRRRGAAALELHSRDQALRAALDGAAPPQETAYRLGLPAGTPVLLIGFAPAGAPPEVQALLTRLGGDLGRHWSAVRPSAAVATAPGAVYALLPGEDPESGRRLAAQALAAVARPRTQPLRAALSESATGLSELAELRAEVDDVLRVTARDPEAPAVAALADVHARVLLTHLADELTRRPRLRHPGIEAMLEHDRTHHTHYAASVSAWLDAVGNISEAASRLTIHQNTLKYRLRRSRELFGLDLDDPDTRLSSWFQLRIGAGKAGRSQS
ncbi:helix-turn-helix domain-containing protein [Streptomyces sp. ISL-98]|uniref:PucR family transcriptional regulator n=1 Tax=Streptomyces sp. ISL-98 TaxID=2819192 RepID=UPI001BE847CA|nr:helix-turn-helix domain-containing protein [Streptomyces sp. ISL-98]MBT2511414.1 helix-turn-helix domain-containing protein [Streptomyces sp. ISL-98]